MVAAAAATAAEAYLVPTTVTYAALQREGVAAGMPAELVQKVGAAVEQVGLPGQLQSAQPSPAVWHCDSAQLVAAMV